MGGAVLVSISGETGTSRDFNEQQYEEMRSLLLGLGIEMPVPKPPEELNDLLAVNPQSRDYVGALRFNATVLNDFLLQLNYDHRFGVWQKDVLDAIWKKLCKLHEQGSPEIRSHFGTVGFIFTDLRMIKEMNTHCGLPEADRVIRSALRVFRGTGTSVAHLCQNAKVRRERRAEVRLSEHTVFRTRSGDEFVRLFLPMRSASRLYQISQQLQDQLYGKTHSLTLQTLSGEQVKVPVAATMYPVLAKPAEDNLEKLIDQADEQIHLLRLGCRKYAGNPFKQPKRKIG